MIGTDLAIPTTLPLPGGFLHISDVALAKPSLKAGSKFLLFFKTAEHPSWVKPVEALPHNENL